MHHRTECEMTGRVDVTGLDPPARGGDETGGRDRLGPRFGHRTVPDREPPFDRAALLRRQWRRGEVPMFVEPGHHLAIGRIDETMAEAQPVIAPWRRRSVLRSRHESCRRRAVRARSGHRTGVAGLRGAADRRGQVRRRDLLPPLPPVEVVGDGEMLGHVALPGRHRAAICLDPVRHLCPAFIHLDNRFVARLAAPPE